MPAATDFPESSPRRPHAADSTPAGRRCPLLLLTVALLAGVLAADVAPAAPEQRFKPGDRVKLEFLGQQLEGEVTRLTGTGWPYVKFTWRGREREQPFPPDRLEPVKKPAAIARPRTWSDASGSFRVVATLVERTGTDVRLKKSDGTEITVPLAKLSEADQKWLDQWVPAETAPGGTSC